MGSFWPQVFYRELGGSQSLALDCRNVIQVIQDEKYIKYNKGGRLLGKQGFQFNSDCRGKKNLDHWWTLHQQHKDADCWMQFSGGGGGGKVKGT